MTRETAATASGSQPLGTHAPALRSVMAGVCVLEGRCSLGALSQRGHGSGAVGRAGPGPAPRGVVFAPLTEREYEVVEAVAEGLDNAGVARRLFMSEGTVRNHISSILAKLGLRNRTQVAVAYYRSARAG